MRNNSGPLEMKRSSFKQQHWSPTAHAPAQYKLKQWCLKALAPAPNPKLKLKAPAEKEKKVELKSESSSADLVLGLSIPGAKCSEAKITREYASTDGN